MNKGIPENLEWNKNQCKNLKSLISHRQVETEGFIPENLKSRQKFSKKTGTKLVGYTFGFLRAGAATAKHPIYKNQVRLTCRIVGSYTRVFTVKAKKPSIISCVSVETIAISLCLLEDLTPMQTMTSTLTL